jgi:outer membrane protein insertion porin family
MKTVILASILFFSNDTIRAQFVVERFIITNRQPTLLEQYYESLSPFAMKGYEDSSKVRWYQAIYSAAAMKGYLFATIDSLSIDTLANRRLLVRCVINDSMQVVIDTVSFMGINEIPAKEFNQMITLQQGDPFFPGRLERNIRMILHEYDRRGFPFAKALVEDLQYIIGTERIGVIVRIRIDEGKPLRISQIRVEGNTTTKSSYIVRESRIHLGERYTGDLSTQVKRRLEMLRIFQRVEQPEFYSLEGDSGGVVIGVKDGEAMSFDGILGYVPASGNSSDGNFTGLINLQFRNLFGTGRKFNGRWSRETPSTQEIEIRYAEPWVFTLPLFSEIGFWQRKQDSLYVQEKINIHIRTELADDLMIGGFVVRETTIPAEGILRANNGNRTSLLFGLSLRYDTRDDILTPTSGLLYQTSVQSGPKNIQGKNGTVTKATLQRILMDFSFVSSITSYTLFAFSFHLKDVRSEALEEADLYRFGGAVTLRGYREGQFEGATVALSTIEYRVLLEQKSFAYLFCDAGYYHTAESLEWNVAPVESNKIGYGIGIQFESALGIMGVSFAFGENDTFSTGKIHFRLINEF